MSGEPAGLTDVAGYSRLTGEDEEGTHRRLSRREQEAREQAVEILKLNPKFTIEKYANALTYKNQEHAERALDALRLAGLPA